MELSISNSKIEKASMPGLVKDYTTTITILEHISDAIFILNPMGNIEYANKIALDMLRIDLNDIIGKNIEGFLMLEADVNQENGDVQSYILVDRIYQGFFNEIETALKHQKYVTPVIISFGFVKNTLGEINYIIASAKDITIRKELEKELKQRQLLAVSRDRYRELGELAVNMVHNLGQPITSIRLMVELTQKLIKKPEIDSEAVDQKLNNIINLLNFITDSISNVRNFAYLTEDESVKPLDIKKSIKEAVKQISYELNEQDIGIDITTEKNMPLILANPINIQQVLVTLMKYILTKFKILNSKSAAPNSSDKKILISISNIEDKWIKIKIADNINLKAAKNKNDKHSSAQSLNEYNAINKGFDFSIIKLIITSLGGDTKMIQKRNGGSEFIIRIPSDQKEERAQLFNLIELLHG